MHYRPWMLPAAWILPEHVIDGAGEAGGGGARGPPLDGVVTGHSGTTVIICSPMNPGDAAADTVDNSGQYDIWPGLITPGQQDITG